MADMIERVMNATRRYTVMDFGCLKIAVLAAGILLGVYFYQFSLANITWLWIIFVVSLLWIMYRTFIKYM